MYDVNPLTFYFFSLVITLTLYLKKYICKQQRFKLNFLFFFTDIPDIPDDIRHLRSLQVADFSSNPIPRLPAGFSQLKSLTVLGLNDMSLTSLPQDFGW